jgi:hypothetical protein
MVCVPLALRSPVGVGVEVKPLTVMLLAPLVMLVEAGRLIE